MKKFFTSMILAMAALTISAKEYSGQLMVVVNGMASPGPANINIDRQDNDRYTLSLRNFMLTMAGTEVPVGNITLTDIEGQKQGTDVVTFDVEQTIAIEEGDLDGVAMWLGPMIGDVPIKLHATLEREQRLSVDIDIYLDMLKQTVKVFFDNAATQIPNSDFELFHKESMKTGLIFTTTVTEDEADHWHSFLSGTGSLITIAATKHTEISTDIRPGSKGSKSLLVKAGNVMGVVANGTITTGQLNAGDMTAASTKNCAFADMSKTDRDANGDPFYTELQALPDSLVVWVKFNQKKALAEHPYATVSAAITDGTYYQDPEDKDYTNVVARAANRQIRSTNQWQRLSIPFEYTGNDVDPRCIIVTLSTNADAGQGTDGDELYVDDLELVYNHKLTALKIQGKDVSGFDSNVLEYNAEVSGSLVDEDGNIVADAIQTETDARGAVVSCALVGSDDEQQLLVTVVSADLTQGTTYTVNLTTTTGIRTMHNASSSLISHPSSVYDLQGRKVEMLNVEKLNKQMGQNRSSFQPFNFSTLKRGIYIVNGKKVVIK